MEEGNKKNGSKTHHVRPVILVHLFDARVDQRLQAVAFPLNAELPLSLQFGSRQQHVLHECEDTVLFHHLGGCLGLANLLGDDLGRI